MGFSTAPIEQIGWFERCENSPCLNHPSINSDGLEGAIRHPIQQEEVVGRALSGSVCWLPTVMHTPLRGPLVYGDMFSDVFFTL